VLSGVAGPVVDGNDASESEGEVAGEVIGGVGVRVWSQCSGIDIVAVLDAGRRRSDKGFGGPLMRKCGVKSRRGTYGWT
jgi:hypothetical protein